MEAPAASEGGAMSRKEAWDRYLISGKGFLGALIARLKPSSHYSNLGRLRLPFATRILDAAAVRTVNCELQDVDYQHLVGVDPFIESDLSPAPNVRLLRGTMADLEAVFDFIMVNHSLEHMPDQHDQFRQIARLLAPGGQCMIRVPVVDSFAWEEYRTDWVQLDAPRHFYLHTRKSMAYLAAEAGLAIVDCYCNSSRFSIPRQ